MTDILDRSVAEIRATRFSVEEARKLLAAEEAGKTRKGVVAHLKGVIESAPRATEFVVTAEGAGRIHRLPGEFYAEGDEINGAPDALDELERRGFIRRV